MDKASNLPVIPGAASEHPDPLEQMPQEAIWSKIAIDIPSEHALCKLWSQWLGEEPTPKRLTCWPEAQIPPGRSLGAAEQEMELLEQVLSRFALQRLEKLREAEVQMPSLDEQAIVHISQDEMVVWMVLFPLSRCLGGSACTGEGRGTNGTLSPCAGAGHSGG